VAQFDAVASESKSSLVGWAQYRAGEALIQEKQYDQAIQAPVAIRDNGQYQKHCRRERSRPLAPRPRLCAVQNWDASRQAYERLVGAFGNSPWVTKAATHGLAWQQQKNYDQAPTSTAQVAGRTATELGAKAQLQIGLCRLSRSVTLTLPMPCWSCRRLTTIRIKRRRAC